jgi:hypothetical protein
MGAAYVLSEAAVFSPSVEHAIVIAMPIRERRIKSTYR